MALLVLNTDYKLISFFFTLILAVFIPANILHFYSNKWLEPFFEIQDAGRSPSWILCLHHFRSHEKVVAHKSSLASKFDEDRWNGLEVRANFRNSRWRTVAILDFVFKSFMVSCKSCCSQKSVFPQNLVQIGEMVWKLKPFSEIQDGERSPSWILSPHHFRSPGKLLHKSQSFLKIWCRLVKRFGS